MTALPQQTLPLEIQRNFDALGQRYVTTLPQRPADGTVVLYAAATNVIWQLRYNAASASAYKWEFVGGGQLLGEVVASEDRGSGTVYAALTTAGPSIALPLAGDYEINGGYVGRISVAGTAWMSYDIGATAAVDADGWNVSAAAAGVSFNAGCQRRYVKTFTAAVTLTSKYRNSGGSGSAIFGQRFLSARPVRVG